jgi:quercetin dioxygenase-like cupin family protein
MKNIRQSLARLQMAAADAYEKTGEAEAGAVAGMLRNVTADFVLPARDLNANPDFLAPAIAAMPACPLRDAVTDCALEIGWTVGGSTMPESFRGRSAYVEIAGPQGLAETDALRFGLFVQMPGSFYPPHQHAAVEDYYVLSGSARWQKGDGDFQVMPPGSLIRHASWQKHAMETAGEGLLALWVWRGDLDMDTYRIEEA